MSVLAPICLEELQARAALTTRVDRKYVLAEDALPGLLERLPADTRVLQIGGRQRFGYHSVYLDTPRLDAYLGAAHRRRHRFKVRVRTYLDSGDRFTEVKTPGPRGVTVKHRTPYAGGDEVGRFVHATIGRGVVLTPALTTWYERVTLFLPASASRVTIDTGLTFALPGGGTLALPGRSIVETKSAHGAGEVDRLLWRLGHRPCAMSKYGTGLAALRPDLPANRWLPVLRRHFPDQESR
ncbi:polyphosphate polymerase domain-containing protein [Dactylosporangium sp. CS-033363]|uniref:polyphosphate polymerase domain-containing protein n=1 Tax=Dactylosporangium sp. CS-033363 TaxID=3239935 RepID=UPI003D8ACD18